MGQFSNSDQLFDLDRFSIIGLVFEFRLVIKFVSVRLTTNIPVSTKLYQKNQICAIGLAGTILCAILAYLEVASATLSAKGICVSTLLLGIDLLKLVF